MKRNAEGKPRCMNCGNGLNESSLPAFCNQQCWDEWAKDYLDAIEKEDGR